MAAYKKTYLQHFNYGEQDFIPCERCGRRAVDIHHILYKSLGGDDSIDNLMALCRVCHDSAHDQKIPMEELQKIHAKFLKL
jgi:5-methylcytosine-specific restriction endonuclease McrA